MGRSLGALEHRGSVLQASEEPKRRPTGKTNDLEDSQEVSAGSDDTYPAVGRHIPFEYEQHATATAIDVRDCAKVKKETPAVG
jgi:hypothetical protein